MADSAIEVLTRALSGHGINEKAMIDTLGNWDHEHKKLFRIKSSHIFSEDERSFERWQEHAMRLLKHEFMRFKNAVVLWTTHPWERDARLVREALSKGNHGQNINILIEVACTRTSDELLGARKAYHSLFDHSIEEDVASHINAPERKDLDWDLKLQDAVLCLANPVKYFTHILEVSLKVDADKKVKKVLTRIIVTRADKDMKEIKIEFKNKFGVSLEEKIESVCNGSYKDFLLTLLARSD
ncbi:Annexin D4 [Cucurbita argyrosperma subsp. argyrosperma]|nr:Annexin D4 [Cucurbita argyrosperma subsp. argyrosperma]